MTTPPDRMTQDVAARLLDEPASRYPEACLREAERWDRIARNEGSAYARNIARRWREKAGA